MRPLRLRALAAILLALAAARPVVADEVDLPLPPPDASTPVLLDEDAEPPPSVFDQAFDLLFLRPFGVVQIVASSVFLVIAYPVAVVTGGEGELVRACIRDPAYQTFQRPLGRLSQDGD